MQLIYASAVDVGQCRTPSQNLSMVSTTFSFTILSMHSSRYLRSCVMVDRPEMKPNCLDESSLLIIMSHYNFLYEFFLDFADGVRLTGR